MALAHDFAHEIPDFKIVMLPGFDRKETYLEAVKR